MCNEVLRLNKLVLLVLIALVFAASRVVVARHPRTIQKVQTEAQQLVEQMRGFSMQLAASPPSDGSIDPREEHRREITKGLRQLGKEAIPALVRALSDPDVQMRRNATLVITNLAGGYTDEAQPKLDIREAISDLIKATEDQDGGVRSGAAHALAEVGLDASEAIPALVRLVQDREEGPRNTSCLALGKIGPAAKDALPALREALNDPSKDVRRFAQQAIEKIQKE